MAHSWHAIPRAVWTALTMIAPGETLSYGALAAKLGCPKSVRAVARPTVQSDRAWWCLSSRDRRRWLLTGYGGGSSANAGCSDTRVRRSATGGPAG